MTKVSCCDDAPHRLLELRALQHLDDPIAEGEGIGQRLHPDGVLGDALDPEGRRFAAERNDQAVVVEPMEVAVAAHDDHLVRLEVDPLHLRGHRPARGPSQLGAQRRHAVASLEVAGADFGKQGRVQREVLAVDEPDLDVVPPSRQALQVARRLDAGESPAEDEDPVRPGRLGSMDRAHRSR
jgi:hypothetical protein